MHVDNTGEPRALFHVKYTKGELAGEEEDLYLEDLEGCLEDKEDEHSDEEVMPRPRKRAAPRPRKPPVGDEDPDDDDDASDGTSAPYR